jgi:hypothetical protein
MMNLRAVEGLDAVVHTAASGNTSRMVPALSFFRVLHQSPSTGRRHVYWNITIGEPTSELFEPPANAAVKELTKPRGITINQLPPA